MNDFDKAAKNIGNRFELVLVASQRMREIHAKRKEQEDLGLLTTEQRRQEIRPCEQAISDIENKLVGREYLDKLQSKNKRRQFKFDNLT